MQQLLLNKKKQQNKEKPLINQIHNYYTSDLADNYKNKFKKQKNTQQEKQTERKRIATIK